MGQKVPDQVLELLSPATVGRLIDEGSITHWPHEVNGWPRSLRDIMRTALAERQIRAEGIQAQPLGEAAIEYARAVSNAGLTGA